MYSMYVCLCVYLCYTFTHHSYACYHLTAYGWLFYTPVKKTKLKGSSTSWLTSGTRREAGGRRGVVAVTSGTRSEAGGRRGVVAVTSGTRSEAGGRRGVVVVHGLPS